MREIHRELMTGVRGGEASRVPGEFRRSRNWIGGSSPDNARFVPPPVDDMRDALTTWEKAIHDTQRFPPLVHIGLLHSQFETIHPFLDGNGRAGRLLITFLLTEREILARPLLYLSIFFKAHQDEYYARLQSVRDHGDPEPDKAREGALEAAVRDLAEAATAEELGAAMEAVRQIPIDRGRMLNALRVPDDAGASESALRALLERIPDG